MNNIQELRAGLKGWLSTKVRIDKWDLDEPDYLYSPHSTEDLVLPANTALEFPVKDLQYFRENHNAVKGSGLFTYQIRFKYPGELTLHELPLQNLEALVQYIQGQALLNPPCANGTIIKITPDSVSSPISINREKPAQDDWIVYCTFTFQILFKLTAFGLPDEFKPVDPDTPINPDFNIELNVYRAKVNFDSSKPGDSTLDTSLTISKN